MKSGMGTSKFCWKTISFKELRLRRFDSVTLLRTNLAVGGHLHDGFMIPAPSAIMQRDELFKLILMLGG
jgi:hypothetical protein